MATIVKTKTGKNVTLLNPAERSRKYAAELKSGVRLTNDGVVKVDKKGNYMGLNCCQRAFRSGVLNERQQSAKAYNAKNGIKSKAKPKTRKRK